MKNTLLAPLLILAFFAFGCGLLDKFKANSNANSNVAAPTASATPTAAPTAAPSASPTPFDKASLGKNLLAFGAGAIVIANTSQAAFSDGSARRINDEAGSGWHTAVGAMENQSVTLELPARTTLKTIVFDTAQPTAYNGLAAKDVVIEISDESAAGGYQTILEATLQDSSNHNGVDNQMFPVQKEIAGRFVRYTAKNNHGPAQVIFTKELSGYGEQEPLAPVGNVSGTYNVPGFIGANGFEGSLVLKQEGNTIIGCFHENAGILEGAIDGRVLTMIASTKDSRAKNEKSSFVAANVIDNGKTILFAFWGWSAVPRSKNYDSLYTGTKISDTVGNCAHMPDLGGKQDVVKENLEKELSETGKAILYGINFDFNSDVIRPESKPTLDKVIAILKEKPDWKFSVEGHTDNIGGEAFNQTLSEKRAAAVVEYLTGAGIVAEDRLTAKGFGLSKPLAPNNSEAERAQNRRVELVKQ